VVKQSLFGLPGQYGRRVTKANKHGVYRANDVRTHATASKSI